MVIQLKEARGIWISVVEISCIKHQCLSMQVCTVRWTSTSATAIPARMVPRAKTLPTPIGVNVPSQNLARSHGVGMTVTSAWSAANSTNVNMRQVVFPY